MVEQVDAIVVGLGVGGEEVAGRLAEAGLAVVGIEDRLVGGECPYWGCVPSKMMIRAANLLAEAKRLTTLAGTASVAPDWSKVARRIRDVATDNWDDAVAVKRFTDKGGRFVRGRGRLAGPDTVQVGDDTYQATTAVVLGVGTAPSIPPIPGLSGTPFWTNREAIECEHLPASLLVLGGGAVGLELAQAYARFGVRVSLIEALERLLGMEEPESSQLIERIFGQEGIEVRTGAKVGQVDHDGELFTLHLDGGPDEAAVRGEKLLVATGRTVNLAELGVEHAGLDPKAHSIGVDDRMRAGERLWAVGDATGHGAFTHMAMYQADIAVRDILGQGGPSADYRAVPRVTFTDPEIGAVGLTEDQARHTGVRVATAVTPLPPVARAWIHGPGNDGFLKLVSDADRDVLIGATSAGPVGGEALSMLALAVHAQVPLSMARNMIYAYPTFHRGIETVVKELPPL